MKRTSNNRKQKGQGLVEYALIVVMVSVVVIAVLIIMGPTIGNVYTKVACNIQSPGADCGSLGGGGGGNPTATATPPSSINIFTVNWGGCSGTCTNTNFSGCVSGDRYTIHFTASSYGGSTSTGSSMCSGGSAFAGNFVQAQTVYVTDNVTGLSSGTYVVPAFGVTP